MQPSPCCFDLITDIIHLNNNKKNLPLSYNKNANRVASRKNSSTPVATHFLVVLVRGVLRACLRKAVARGLITRARALPITTNPSNESHDVMSVSRRAPRYLLGSLSSK